MIDLKLSKLATGTLRLIAFGCALGMLFVANLHAEETASQADNPKEAVDLELPPILPNSAQTGKSQPVAMAGQATLLDENWSIQITPAYKPTAQAEEVDEEPEAQPITQASYEEIYDAIPYRRSEYLANPSYRHDTAVEILFGEMRPAVIQRTDNPVRVQNPSPQIFRPDMFPYLGDYRRFYWNQGLYSRGLFPQQIFPAYSYSYPPFGF